jgi:hypothetical protein
VQCAVCGAAYRKESTLRAHLSRAHPAHAPFPCTLCPASFLSYDSLAQHTRSQHELLASPNLLPSIKPNLLASAKPNLLPSIKPNLVVAGTKPNLLPGAKPNLVACQYCGGRFSPVGLDSHMRTHKDCTVVDWPIEETESSTVTTVKMRGGEVMGACSASEEGEVKGNAKAEVLPQSEAGANQQLVAHCGRKSGTVLSSTPERR